ncbi:ABC transporter ATP-binding protein [Paraclostridium bifermentans]|uniref:ABC transporter ATP-binding protein n=1 Tax=Paraclostridium bifermentans TaxID=1490 RepID=A0ABY8R653_PARBF|nr:ABC transporter ATP-binding protein [Paraclostridium bifermentans]
MISCKNLKVGYEEKVIIENLSLSINKGEVVSIIGPNGCGKSTLLKTLSRIIKPMSGGIYIQNESIRKLKSKHISQKVCLLSQHNDAPGDLTVEELVYFGRIPHKKWYESKTKSDEEIVNWAIENTGLKKYKNTPINSLSGGERQRAYIAQALCQNQIYFY